MSASTQPNAYLRTKVMTASPAELRLMLFDGAIKFAEQARAGLDGRDYEAVYTGITRCQDIVMELLNSLRPEQQPEICDKLAALYTFMYSHLVTASSERDPAKVDEVIELLRYERETWQMVLDRLAEENASARRLDRAPDAAPTSSGAPSGASDNAAQTDGERPAQAPNGASKLVGGSVSLQG